MSSLWTESEFKDIEAKIESRQPLRADEARRLASSKNLPYLGALATRVRERISEKKVYVTTYIGSLLQDNALQQLNRIKNTGTGVQTQLKADEMHVFYANGPLQDWDTAYHENFVNLLERCEASQKKCFSLYDLNALEPEQRQTLIQNTLKPAGITELSEGELACALPNSYKGKTISFDRVMALHVELRQQGLYSDVAFEIHPNMTEDELISKLSQLRILQLGNSVLNRIVITIPFNKEMFGKMQIPVDGITMLHYLAIIRIFMESVNRIAISWALQDPKLAQTTLSFGVNDLGAVWSSELLAKEKPEGVLGVGRQKEIQKMIDGIGGQMISRKAVYAS